MIPWGANGGSCRSQLTSSWPRLAYAQRSSRPLHTHGHVGLDENGNCHRIRKYPLTPNSNQTANKQQKTNSKNQHQNQQQTNSKPTAKTNSNNQQQTNSKTNSKPTATNNNQQQKRSTAERGLTESLQSPSRHPRRRCSQCWRRSTRFTRIRAARAFWCQRWLPSTVALVRSSA